MIDKKFIKKMKKKLQKDKKNLEKDLATFADKNIHNLEDYNARYPNFGSEADENAKEVSTFEDRLSVEKTLETELRDVNNSLERIKNETYGFCHNCKEEIPLARLEARPTASTCVKCKEELKSKN